MAPWQLGKDGRSGLLGGYPNIHSNFSSIPCLYAAIRFLNSFDLLDTTSFRHKAAWKGEPRPFQPGSGSPQWQWCSMCSYTRPCWLPYCHP